MWVLGGLVACAPDPGGESAGAGSTGGTSSEAGSTGDAEGEPELLDCAERRYEVTFSDSEIVDSLVVASTGHLWARKFLNPGFRAIELDASGAIVGEIELGDEIVDLAGVDAAGGLYVIVGGSKATAWRTALRKYAPGGALVWERDMGHVNDDPSGVGVAPDGSVVISRASTLSRFDAGGALAWELPVEPEWEQQLRDINAAGMIVTLDMQTISGVWRVSVREADGGLRWVARLDGHPNRVVALDGDGGALVDLVGGALIRFDADGAVAWETNTSALGLKWGGDAAMNEAGEVVLVGSAVEGPGTPIVTLDAKGAPAAVRTCDDAASYRVAIDEAGAVYVSGFVQSGDLALRAFD